MSVAPSVLDLNKKWFVVALPLRTCSLKDIATTVTSKEDMDRYFQEAQAVLEKEASLSQMDRGRWYNAQFLTRGTTSDRIASAAVKLADTDFMFFLEGFNLLFDTARTDTHHYEAALKALAAVWPRLLPPRPLKRFASQYFATLPTDDQAARQKVLVYWYLEDYLKRTYTQFLSLSESMLKDRIVQRREAWLDVVGKLMCSVAEGRSTAMAMMIDKLGDPNAQIAHKAYHHLLTLLSESSTHQQMLFTELEKIIFMKNCPLRTMRYAANVMNQLVYSRDERKLAIKAVQTYLSLFRQLVLLGNVDSTVTTAVIVGLRRAFPYTGTDISSLTEHINALFVLANTASFQQRVATLSLLQLLAQGKTTPDSFQDRWYRALYQLLLLSPKQIPQSTQLTNFFSLLHKAMRADKKVERIAAFVHRLLQRAVYYNEAMICAVLLLVGEMAQAHSSIRELIQSPKSKLLRAQKQGHQPPPPPQGAGGSSSSRLHATPKKAAGDDEFKPYDPKSRDPQYARASSECLWVLSLFTRHSHPSVVRLAVLLLFGEEIVFDSHPLDDMTPLNFLQMFVDAKAREDESEKKATGMSVFRRASRATMVPSASDPYFINANAQEVDVAALFLHRYAVQRQRFLDSLSQVKSSWGDVSGEVDVATRVAQLDTALFGPAGMLGEAKAAAGAETEEATATEATEKKKKKKDKAGKKAAAPAEVESDREDSPVEDFADFDDADLGSEDMLEWGMDEEDEGNLSDEEEYEDDEEGDASALHDRKKDALDDGDDFGEVIEEHKKEMSKKRKREEQWMDSRSRGYNNNNNSFSSRRPPAAHQMHKKQRRF